ncbi:MAG: carboxylating nicotinate-nucleotide diphosphorylase [Alphaproteobacteria bacterium]|nr:carboxylating nicotinate-nucleotide diphosphorylase [Alphaproteobacteria bacterium]
MPSADFSVLRPPHRLLVEPCVRRALEEDLGHAGDLTSDLVIPPDRRVQARLVARQPGIVAGSCAAEIAFRLVDEAIELRAGVQDGERARIGAVLLSIDGPARGVLTAERVALNFVGRLSGIATATRALVDAVAGTKARVVCTRKTTPGLRTLEKYAVRCGGGFNHRFGLDDAVLIKDNHIIAAGGIAAAVAGVRAGLGHMAKIEVEVDSLEQLEEVLALGVDTILLDNMRIEHLKRAVEMSAGRAVLEASGGVTLDTVRAIAETGVDYISSGAITHSAPSLDVALDF